MPVSVTGIDEKDDGVDGREIVLPHLRRKIKLKVLSGKKAAFLGSQEY